MMNYLLGNTEQSTALAFAVMLICICVAITSAIVNRRTRREIDHDFELKKIELRLGDEKSKRQIAKERDVELGSIASKREIEFKRIDTAGTIDVTANGREDRFKPRGSSGGDPVDD